MSLSKTAPIVEPVLESAEGGGHIGKRHPMTARIRVRRSDRGLSPARRRASLAASETGPARAVSTNGVPVTRTEATPDGSVTNRSDPANYP